MKRFWKKLRSWVGCGLLAGSLWLGSNATAPVEAQATGAEWIGFLVLDGATDMWYLVFVHESELALGSAADTATLLRIFGPAGHAANAIPLGPAAGAPPAAGAGAGAGAGVGGLVATATVVIVAAVVGTIAIDYAVHGNFFWEPVNEAGGFGIVLGFSPSPSAAPNPTFVTVGCNPDAGPLQPRCRTALSNIITGYYTWFGGAYWTCGEMWASSGSSALWNQELAKCNALVNQCVQQTIAACQQGGMPLAHAGAWGDPHLTTFDGLAYDFQGAGEYVLAKAGEDFEIQARFLPWGGAVSVTGAVSARVGTSRVAVYAGQSPPLRIDGEPVTEPGTVSLPGGGTVTSDGSAYDIVWANGDRLRVTDNWSFLSVDVDVMPNRAGTVAGLLGNADADVGNELVSASGQALAQPVSLEDLYSVFGDSWRVTAATSLFDYAEGESTVTFTDANFPLGTLPSDVTQLADDPMTEAEMLDAQAACEAAGVMDPIAFQGCVHDVWLTGDPSFADAAAEAPPPVAAVQVDENGDTALVVTAEVPPPPMEPPPVEPPPMEPPPVEPPPVEPPPMEPPPVEPPPMEPPPMEPPPAEPPPAEPPPAEPPPAEPPPEEPPPPEGGAGGGGAGGGGAGGGEPQP